MPGPLIQWRSWGRVSLRTAAAVLIGLLAFVLSRTDFFQSLEESSYDLRVALVAAGREPDPRLIVITIDDVSLSEMDPVVGSWPWPRAIFGGIVEYCSQASVFGLDIVLSENDWRYNLSDQAFVEAVASVSNVVSAAVVSRHPVLQPRDEEFVRAYSLFVHQVELLDLPAFNALLPPFRSLLKATRAIGFVNYFPGRGDRVRSYPLLVQYNGDPYPSMALSIAAQASGNTNRLFYLQPDRTIESRDMTLKLSPTGEFRLVYPRQPPRTIPVMDILRSIKAELAGEPPLVPRETFRDAIVLMGSTATGLQDDRKATPLGPRLPGVFLQAIAIDNILHNRQFVTPVEPMTMLLCLLLAAPAWALRRGSIRTVYAVNLASALAYAAVVFVSCRWLWMLPLTGPALAWGLSLTAYFGYRWNGEQRETRRLQHIEQAKQKFTDMLVHDLKGLVGNFGISLEFLRDAPRNEEETLYLDAMSATQHRMLAQILSLLDIRRIEDGRMPLNPEPAALHPLLDRIMEQLKPSAAMAELSFETHYDPGLQGSLNLDVSVFQRVVTNLLLNALQYGKPGTAVQVDTRVGDDSVEIEIRNQGRNIPPEAHHTLFRPFDYFDLRQSNTRTVSTGLGLAFCKLAMDAHQGSIHLESPLPDGQDGVLVRLRLPYPHAACKSPTGLVSVPSHDRRPPSRP